MGRRPAIFGLLEVCNGRPQGDHGLVVGVRNSHDQSFPASIALGSAVFVCDNLSFCGEITICAGTPDLSSAIYLE